jgi:hypothetical protein
MRKEIIERLFHMMILITTRILIRNYYRLLGKPLKLLEDNPIQIIILGKAENLIN